MLQAAASSLFFPAAKGIHLLEQVWQLCAETGAGLLQTLQAAAVYGIVEAQYTIIDQAYHSNAPRLEASPAPKQLTAAAGADGIVEDPETMVRLHNPRNNAQVLLVGTHHASRNSLTTVRDILARVQQPATVFLEADPSDAARFEAVSSCEAALHRAKDGSLAQLAKHPQEACAAALGALHAALRRIGLQQPGLELQAAAEEARRSGLQVILGDEPADVIRQRVASCFSLRGLWAMLASLPSLPQPPGGILAGRRRSEVLTRAGSTAFLEWLRESNPRFATVFVDERNQHMTEQLLRLEGRVVAIVGHAHLDGIESRWHQAFAALHSASSSHAIAMDGIAE